MEETCKCKKYPPSHPLAMPKSIKAEPVLGWPCDVCKKPRIIGWMQNSDDVNDDYLISELGDVDV
ncbi:hypothetical protein LCGC14_2043970 [marine sediment metagenome]|uniref:Uncharacterized protein n=1 Tax=marine sediment metagenome TaxID=412755 RepID=A0A0F9HN05_9ZZZZ